MRDRAGANGELSQCPLRSNPDHPLSGGVRTSKRSELKVAVVPEGDIARAGRAFSLCVEPTTGRRLLRARQTILIKREKIKRQTITLRD